MADIQGGGVTSHEGVEVYIDLIVGNLSSIEIDYPQTAALFAAFAKYRQGMSNFGYAELEKDDRLYKALSKTEEGVELYEKLRRSVPIITVSNKILGDATNTGNVSIFRLSELEENPLGILDNIQKAACVSTSAERRAFLDGIERLNQILSIKPGFFGISINVNEVINEWVKKRRASGVQIKDVR
jgi:hypothetical protein